MYIGYMGPEKVVDDLDPTEDGESSEEAHCAPYQAQLSLSCHLCMDQSIVLSDCVLFCLMVSTSRKMKFWIPFENWALGHSRPLKMYAVVCCMHYPELH